MFNDISKFAESFVKAIIAFTVQNPRATAAEFAQFAREFTAAFMRDTADFGFLPGSFDETLRRAVFGSRAAVEASQFAEQFGYSARFDFDHAVRDARGHALVPIALFRKGEPQFVVRAFFRLTFDPAFRVASQASFERFFDRKAIDAFDFLFPTVGQETFRQEAA